MFGIFPTVREDGLDWTKKDVARATWSGKHLGFHAAVLQVQGDWAFYKEVFAFPHWTSHQCCWKCCAKAPLVMLEVSGMPAQRHHGDTRALQGSSS